MSDADDFEVIKNEASNAIAKAYKSIKSSSSTQQIIIGSATGWTSGYIAMKVGRTAAFALGGGIILLQVAQQNGYITIDWEKIKRNSVKVADKIETTCTENSYSWMNKVKVFAFSNSCFAAGFVGGFLIGMAT